MFLAICILLIIASILLVLVVLIQNSKGGGLAANFAAGNQTFGVRQTADYLEKATWTLAIIVLVLCFAGTSFMPKKGSLQGGSAVQNQIENIQGVGTNQPQFPVGGTATGEQQQQQQPVGEQPVQPEN